MAFQQQYYYPPPFATHPPGFPANARQANTRPAPTITEFYGPAHTEASQQPYVRASLPPPATRQPWQPNVQTNSLYPLHRMSLQQHHTRPPPPDPPLHSKPPSSQGKPQFLPPDPSRVTPLAQLDTWPAYVDCPWCLNRTRTRVKKENGDATKRLAGQMLVLVLVGGLLPVALHWHSDLAHYCSECKAKLALQQYSLELKRHGRSTPYNPERKVQSTDAKRRDKKATELDGSPTIPEAGDKSRIEKDGIIRVEMDGSTAPVEIDTQERVYEMEHVNRSKGTQKRIQNKLKRLDPEEEPRTDQDSSDTH